MRTGRRGTRGDVEGGEDRGADTGGEDRTGGERAKMRGRLVVLMGERRKASEGYGRRLTGGHWRGLKQSMRLLGGFFRMGLRIFGIGGI